MNQNRQQGELHFTRLYLAAQVFRCAADHHAADEYTDDDVEEHIDQADADSAEDDVEPHSDHGKEPGKGIEAVMHGIHRTVARGCCQRCPCRPRRGPEAKLLAFQVAGGFNGQAL